MIYIYIYIHGDEQLPSSHSYHISLPESRTIMPGAPGLVPLGDKDGNVKSIVFKRKKTCETERNLVCMYVYIYICMYMDGLKHQVFITYFRDKLM